MYMLEQELSSLEGANAVVLGRSNIVGMPVALLLVRAKRHCYDLPLAQPGFSGDLQERGYFGCSGGKT